MKKEQIRKIFDETAYIRMGGSAQELQCAEYLRDSLAAMGLKAQIVPFEVPMATMQEAVLTVNGRQIPCKGYLCAGNWEVEAPLYYLRNNDKFSLSLCKGKIVLIDGYLGYWMYQDLLENGAVGFLTYNGETNYPDRDIDQRELRSYVHQGKRLPGMNINVKDAVAIMEAGAASAKMVLRQEESTGNSHNVVLDLPGQLEEYIVLTAHYDTTSLSQGAYDNMSGCVGMLGLAEHFMAIEHRYGLRFVWCGSEERGLLGSKAWCAAAQDLEKCVMNINLDMIGCIMGKFIACCTTEEAMISYLNYMARELGFPMHVYQDVYSSDSTPFADHGIPAVSFARIAPHSTATIHNSYDTVAVMSEEQMVQDLDFLVTFTDRMANAFRCPVSREIPENMRQKLDEYLCRKRPQNK